MNRFIVFSATAAALLVAGTSADAAARKGAAQSSKPNVEVTQRDASGHATAVRIEGQEYQLCSKTVTDSCINPHDAGFNWGNTELSYWPGKPASEIPGKLPANRPTQTASAQ